MREILFRGKRIDNGEWIEGSGFLREGDTCWIYGKIKREGDCFNDWEKVDPTTVGQYTGLTANGKKIFEGDILAWDEHEWGSPHNELVTWDYGLFAMRKNDWHEFCLVIGNIHDNPELLEVDNGT